METIKVIVQNPVVVKLTKAIDYVPLRIVKIGALKGDKGDIGTPGLNGSGTASFVYNQSVPSSLWNITHNLGYFPNVTVTDSAGSLAEGDTKYVNNNLIQILFSSAFSGVAYLS